MTAIITIDPTDTASPYKHLLLEILAGMSDELPLIESNTSYDLETADGKQYKIALTYNILRRKRSKNKVGYCFEAFREEKASLIGESNLSKVIKIKRTIAIINNEIIFKVNKDNNNIKNRVVKIEEIKPVFIKIINEKGNDEIVAEQNEKLKKEFYLTQKIDYVHIKEPVLLEEIEVSANVSDDDDDYETIDEAYIAVSGKKYTVMRELPGVDLFDILKDDRDDTLNATLTTEQRFKLTIALLKALKEIHKKGLLHRDIKPENIKIDLSNPNEPIVYIFDFNLSRDLTEKNDKSAPGTFGYAAPEVCRGTPPDASCDLYAMGRVIGLIWRAAMQDIVISKNAYEKTCNYNFPELFTGITDIDDWEKRGIRWILGDMNFIERYLRPTIESVIEVFEKIFAGYQTRNSETSKKLLVNNAVIKNDMEIASESAPSQTLTTQLSDLSPPTPNSDENTLIESAPPDATLEDNSNNPILNDDPIINSKPAITNDNEKIIKCYSTGELSRQSAYFSFFKSSASQQCLQRNNKFISNKLLLASYSISFIRH